MDLEAAERAAADLLTALGADLGAESLNGTPRRMARLYGELITPATFNATTFPNDGGYDELVVACGIPFHSLCEHHLLPFHGRMHVGYLPARRIIGLSKIPRIVELYARRFQVQERLTEQVADALIAVLEPKGVVVLAEAQHMCMAMRGVQKHSTTTTRATRGAYQELLPLIKGN